MWVAAVSAIVAVALLVLAVFTPRQDPPLRFRVHIHALEPDQYGIRAWWWEVHDDEAGGEVVVSGCSPQWQRALEAGLTYRIKAQQGYLFRNAPSWQEAVS